MRELPILIGVLYFYFLPEECAFCVLATLTSIIFYKLTFIRSKICIFSILFANSFLLAIQIDSCQNLLVWFSFFCIGSMLNALFISIQESEFKKYDFAFVLLEILFACLVWTRAYEVFAVFGGLCSAATCFGFYIQIRLSKDLRFDHSHSPFHVFKPSRNKQFVRKSSYPEDLFKDCNRDSVSSRRKYSSGLFAMEHGLNYKGVRCTQGIYKSSGISPNSNDDQNIFKTDVNKMVQALHWHIKNIDLCRINLHWSFTGSIRIFAAKMWLLGMKLILLLAIRVIQYVSNK